jgi:hypothetical protein
MDAQLPAFARADLVLLGHRELVLHGQCVVGELAYSSALGWTNNVRICLSSLPSTGWAGPDLLGPIYWVPTRDQVCNNGV